MAAESSSPSRLYYLSLFYRDSPDEKSNGKSYRLAQAADFSAFSFFVRSTAGDAIKFASRTVINRINSGCRVSVSSGDPKAPYMVHAFLRSDGLGSACVTDEHYDKRVAFVLVSKLIQSWEKEKSPSEWKNISKDIDLIPDFLRSLLVQYQNPKDADLLTKIHSQVAEVKGNVLKNINQVLANGETIDALMDKSDDLDAQSKKFLKQAKKTNSCCRFGF
jgi:synaptobrevin family protein YKT6